METNGIRFSFFFSLTTLKSSLATFIAFSIPLSMTFWDIFDLLILFLIHPCVFVEFLHFCWFIIYICFNFSRITKTSKKGCCTLLYSIVNFISGCRLFNKLFNSSKSDFDLVLGIKQSPRNLSHTPKMFIFLKTPKILKFKIFNPKK